MSPHLRGHLLLFEPRPAPVHSSSTGIRLLLAAAVVEVVRLVAVRWRYPVIPLWLLLPTLLGLALWSVSGFAGVKLSHLGFRRWRDWTTTEKSYFLQVVVIANLVFPIVLAAQIRDRVAQPGPAWNIWTVFVPYLFFGFYQEVVYRGLVQVELIRRWGAPIGIFVANVLYTFGPLHWNYFGSRASVAVPMFLATFAIGLFFAIVYRRSGNLWMVSVFHAIGNAYIVWSAQ